MTGWWLSPGKEVLNILFNRILAPYVENLDMNQVNYGIGQGQLTLRNLTLKRGALDKFRLPVDVAEGHLGKFTLSLHWLNLGNQPVEVLIEDVYLLVAPSTQSNYDVAEDEKRAQAAKAERLENAELLHMRSGADASSDDTPQSQGLVASLMAKIINNLQVTVKNIHIRYEDKLSSPGHPFAAGITLAGFTAVSVDENWLPAFVESTAGAIHKLANLESLAVYFDTDSTSMAGLGRHEFQKQFREMIASNSEGSPHQFILKPVSGEGRIVVNHKVDKNHPRFDVQLLFEEIGVALDANQYRDAISLLDMYHVYLRQHQYRRYWVQPQAQLTINTAQSRLRFAGAAILAGVQERNRMWTWEFFKERRDDRNKYVELFQKKVLNTLAPADTKALDGLETKLSYEDIRFYRSIARSRLRKDEALRQRLQAEKAKQQPAQTGWGGWLWGASKTDASKDDATFGGPMTEDQRKELYDVLDYDEKTAMQEALQAPRDSLKARINAKLNKGSFAVKASPQETFKDILSIEFDTFQADVLQRTDNLEASVSLRDFSVFDGTTINSLHPQIVRVKNVGLENGDAKEQEPFLFFKFEKNPLDERADNALTLRLRHMEIVYHKGYVEAIYRFFKPPASQLESVEALLNAASQTLEGLSKETRAGLEFALQNHKTIDIQMDLNAPIIIIPEDVTTQKCKHLLIDAGHIAIESNLADKDAVRAVHTKRSQQYTDEDYRHLEALMYDKFSLKLKSAQFVIGDDLNSCREALTSNAADSLHLLERINIDLQVHTSIVPSVATLAKFKVSGQLPSLQVNMSDKKYKSLMRLIDVAIPKFDDDANQARPTPPQERHESFPLGPGIFLPQTEYHQDDEDDSDDDNDDSTSKDEDQFFEADDGLAARPEIHQHIFELNFRVDQLRASLSKAAADGVEKPLGDVSLDGFGLRFALAEYTMKVDVNLCAMSMGLIQPGMDRIEFMSSAAQGPSTEKDLLCVTYTKAQKASPEFLTLYEGVDQRVDVTISTFVFHAAPEPILTLYDFIMTTFVPQASPLSVQPEETQAVVPDNTPQKSPEDSKIQVTIKLASVQVTLMDGTSNLATLALSTADVLLLLRPNTMRITGRLGSLELTNESQSYKLLPEFQQILSIEGQNFAEFRYQTFDPAEESYAGVKSSVYLNAGSLKFHVLEGPLRDIFLFLIKLAKLKGLYDAATQVAVQRASEIERMQFEVSIKSPIVVFPSDSSSSLDVLVLRLGEVSANNSYQDTSNKTVASLRGIQLTSNLHGRERQPSSLKIIDDIEISAVITQTSGVDRTKDLEFPDTQIVVKISDIRLHLTQVQYGLLIQLSKSIPAIFASSPDLSTDGQVNAPIPAVTTSPRATSVALEPELRVTARAPGQGWTSLDLVVTIDAVKLHLYDAEAHSTATLKEHGIARFALNGNSLRFKMLSDGASEAQVVLKSFTIGNTRPGGSKFREIIPAAQHDRNQFMVLYTMSGEPGGSALAIVTIDSPQVIFAVDPVFALLQFFTSAFSPTDDITDETNTTITTSNTNTPETKQSSLDFRVDLHDVSVCVLEDDTHSDSQAIKLTIGQILLSQQGILALTINRLGMSLTRMGREAEAVRFMDEFDLTFSLDSRTDSSQQMTSIDITSKPIVFRASYRDIMLITTIVNKAIELSNSPAGAGNTGHSGGVAMSTQAGKSTAARSRARSQVATGKARAITSKEQLKASFDGFRLVLIGDMHEQPMMHLKVKRFIVGAKDWSGELHATTTLATQISYWNLTNSHWEPLIDPWTFTITASRSGPTGIDLKLTSRERLDLNVSTTFAELATSSVNMMGKEGAKVLQGARGSYAPYRIRNRTGSSIYLWSDVDDIGTGKEQTGVTIQNDQTIDWRFDDWKTMREHITSSSSGHSVGLQFVGKSWEQLRSVPVDREGEFIFPLRPRVDKYANRVLCEVKVVDNVKVVTLRSTYKIENQTLYPLELTVVDDNGHPVYSLEKIAPGEEYSLPIEAVTQNRIRIQPDQGFGYKWCSAIRWEDLIARKAFTIKCPHADSKEAAFRFQAWVQTDLSHPEPSRIPKIHLKLRAPMELENLLPFNLQYRVYDKNTDQNWKSYLRSGGVMPVHSVELGHLVLLNIEVQDTVFKPSDFAIINTDGNSDFDVEKRLTLRDASDRKLDLQLNYIRYPESGGAFKVQIYAPFLVVNKTNIPFSIRTSRSTRTGAQEVAGDTRPDTLSKPIPFMLSHNNDHSHEFVLKLGDSTWSKVFSVEAPSAEIALALPSQKGKTEEIHVGLSWSEGGGKYKLTKVVTIAPRFLVKNNLAQPLSFREHGVAPRERSALEPGEQSPLLFIRNGQEKLLTVAISGLDAQWSPPINLEDIGSVHLRLRTPGSEDVQLIRAEINMHGSTIFVSLTDADDDWPFLIENDSGYRFSLAQSEMAQRNASSGTSTNYVVQSHSNMVYAWDYPAAREKKLVLTINGSRRVIDVMEIGDLVPFKFNDGQQNRAVSLDVRADGPKQVLRITNYNADFSLYKPRNRSASLTTTRQDTISSNVEAFEAITEDVVPTLSFGIDFAGLGLSLLNKKLVEVVYVSMDRLVFEYTNSSVAQSVTLSCGTLQIDNQLHDAIFPVILQPSPIPKESNGIAALPTVQASVIWLKDEEHGVLFVKYCSVLLQALTIEADEDLLFAILDLTQIQGASWDGGGEDILIQATDEAVAPTQTQAGQDLYFEVLELQPIRLAISFMRTERVTSDQKLSLRNPLAVVVNALTMTVGNINDAPLEMNALAIKDMRLTMPELQERIIYHYRQDVIRQLYRILGSADFIGNPVGLFTNVSSGVADMFYEPFNGVVMHGNKELGIGIAKGAASLVKKTVFGLSDSVTKFTSSVGKGLSAATFDAEYQARRRMTQRRNKPRHAIYGFASGGEALASSVASAMEGVLVKPIEGAESEGAFGFFKGVGKGLVGSAVTKPVIGVFDMASNVSEGIRNTTTVFDSPERDRARQPRPVPSDGVMRPYSAREAMGQYWMRDLNNGVYRQEAYVAHINSPGSDNVVLLTASRIISFWSKKLKMEWELMFTQVSGVTVEDTGIRFSHKGGKEYDKFIFIPDKSAQSWFFDQISKVVKNLNVRRRMDG